MKTRMKWLCLLAVIVPALAACTTPMGRLSVVSSKNLDINNVEMEKVQDDTTGKSMYPIVLFIPTGRPTVDEAVSDALYRTGGDLMQNVVVKVTFWWIPYIYGQQAVTVQGDVYKVKKTAPDKVAEAAPEQSAEGSPRE